jgi:DNA segregation ATPase FtsK/SpoIIIE-like protein
MDSSDVALRLSKLRRELEEILAIVEAHPTNGVRAQADLRQASAPDESSDEHEPVQQHEPPGIDKSRDELYDNALVVVTEFGQATPSILQMWLSIDYSRATQILTQFETEGLVSSKGKLRHKAYARRRSNS